MNICMRCGYSPTGKGRSSPQNKSYWLLCVTPFAEYLREDGYTQDDVHELFKMECNYYIKQIKDRKGNINLIKIPRSTTSLKTNEFNDFMSRCRQYASEHGCYLKEPNERDIYE